MGNAVKVLTRVERERLQRLCANRFLWTDGGHWMGGGASPDCSTSDKREAEHVVNVYFSSDAAADRWNAECERNIRWLGHGGTIALGLASYLTGGSAVAVGALVAASIGKDELQAGIPYPKAYRGSRLRLVHRLTLEWFADPRRRGAVHFKRRIHMSDHAGVRTYSRLHQQTNHLTEADQEVIEALIGAGGTYSSLSL